MVAAWGGGRWAASRNVAGWIPDDVIGMRNEDLEYSKGDKGGRCVGLTTLVPSCAEYLEIGEPQPLGNLRACRGIALPLLDLFSFPRIEPRLLGRAALRLVTTPTALSQLSQ